MDASNPNDRHELIGGSSVLLTRAVSFLFPTHLKRYLQQQQRQA